MALSIKQIYILYRRKKIFFTSEEISDTTFLGINILMGIKKLPFYRDYWSNNTQLNDLYISKLMLVNRFSLILNNFHVNDNSKELPRNDLNYDKLYKLRPMITVLNNNFQTL